MNHPVYQRLRNATSGRRNRLALAAAVVAAAASTTGVALASTGQSTTPTGTAAVAVAELGRTAGQTGQTEAPQPTAPETAAPASPSDPATAEPTRAASSAAKTAPTSTPSKRPAPPASKVLDYQFQAQINGWYCGPAATRIALTVRDERPSQDEVAGDLGTTMSGTNSAQDTTRVLNKVIGTDFYRSTMLSGGAASRAEMDQLQADVVHAVSNGYAVVANIAGSATDVDGGWHSYPGGHYLTVVGYRDNGRTVKIADPAIPGDDSTYWMTTIDLANWAASRGYSS
ncbi:C39 family peptidase [Plantactinospora soyae]|uniref:Peptidase C39-like domain-containing protein n=1 Tax=Plantactinospora soyae TaxID=1544732 RepID=A0A927R8B7_9ACTN|nr:C39 family peptidase [Plantactinospora soyae]MBE1488656.1 hypothetical protein [Plantactinospora soyae]